ncbi:hypothetical protein [Elizabethkingia anophelis]|uniref:hypothetical protein n=2 Tax=Elizabethkingia anophelis TaxID=1117645 RepID=UPI00083FDEA6|nr:hypothetical protein [Elizabethkingia anophelis]OCW75071.1 hypothetical protein A4G24_08350 [Elizabethkingia anophelis]
MKIYDKNRHSQNCDFFVNYCFLNTYALVLFFTFGYAPHITMKEENEIKKSFQNKKEYIPPKLEVTIIRMGYGITSGPVRIVNETNVSYQKSMKNVS